MWAAITGAAQLVAVRRRAQLDNERPLLLAGSLSTIGGIALVLASARENPTLDPLALYVAAGGTEFVIRAGLLARRRRLATLPA